MASTEEQCLQIINPQPNRKVFADANDELGDVLSELSIRSDAVDWQNDCSANGCLKPTISAKAKELFLKVKSLIKQGASINGSLALHKAAANGLFRRLDEMKSANSNHINHLHYLAFLIRLGGDIHHVDAQGETPLHVAAACRPGNMPLLLELGADRNAMDYKGKRAIDYVKEQWESFAKIYKEDCISLSADHVMEHFETLKLLLTETEKSHLKEGWMSPRLLHQLVFFAETEGDACADGHPNLRYLPPNVVCHCKKNSRVLDGFEHCLTTAERLLRGGYAPTVERMKSVVSDSQLRFFTKAGGKIEHAIDTIIGVAQTSECYFETYENDPKVKDLPMTLMDDEYEVAKIMCIDFGGGKLEDKGPYYGTNY